MEIKEIKINCDAKHYASLDDFHELQGNLKDLTELNFNKLKLSILKYGFIAPLFAYKDTKGKLFIMDAHQRVRVLKHLRDVDEYIVPQLPYNLIDAKNKREAKEMLLAINSRYGKMTAEGLYEFSNEPNYEIDMNAIELILDLPEVNLDMFNNAEAKIDSLEENEEIELPQSAQIEPPKEYILIMAEPNSEEWEDLIQTLKLGMVRRGGYKEGSEFDSISLERVLYWNDFKNRVNL
jgi:hypothetical protein